MSQLTQCMHNGASSGLRQRHSQTTLSALHCLQFPVCFQAANLTSLFNDTELVATVFVPNDEAIDKLTASNNITIGDLFNNPLDVLTLVRMEPSFIAPARQPWQVGSRAGH